MPKYGKFEKWKFEKNLGNDLSQSENKLNINPLGDKEIYAQLKPMAKFYAQIWQF